MSEAATLINKFYELTRANNIVQSDIGHISQVIHVITNTGINTVTGGSNSQAFRKQGSP